MVLRAFRSVPFSFPSSHSVYKRPACLHPNCTLRSHSPLITQQRTPCLPNNEQQNCIPYLATNNLGSAHFAHLNFDDGRSPRVPDGLEGADVGRARDGVEDIMPAARHRSSTTCFPRLVMSHIPFTTNNVLSRVNNRTAQSIPSTTTTAVASRIVDRVSSST